MIEEKYARGDWVWIEYGGLTVAGMVILASENGKSLMLGFDGVLGAEHDGMCPVLRCDDGVYRSIINSEEVRLTRAGIRND
ncbi:hypothetical protein ADU20_27280 [Burkholderia pseudomallei]|uniref:hypothetical protein n=1 Tax=Burkholderia pseudomallei TaxID=28450 RepID=UPI0006836690|nr:hypothetical protein [Burkholderia pseudomallei]KNA31028.1 hypothetical protein ADU20_27280 [Burkholderia pseudomallei]